VFSEIQGGEKVGWEICQNLLELLNEFHDINEEMSQKLPSSVAADVIFALQNLLAFSESAKKCALECVYQHITLGRISSDLL
jgi:hypothetical protein